MSDRRKLIVATFLFVLGLSGICPAISITADHSGALCLQCSNDQRIQTFYGSIPPYVRNVPKDHFVGISTPMPSLTEARQSAIDDAKRQILNAMGANYKYFHVDHLSGEAISGNVKRMVDDELSSNSNGFLSQIENNIVDSHWSAEKSGNSVCFVLIRCSEDMIREMQRLSKGAKVIAQLLRIDEKQAVVGLTEINHVCATFVRAKFSVTHWNKWAKVLTLLFWRVDEKFNYDYEIPLSPIRICSENKKLTIPIACKGRKEPFYFFNSSICHHIILYGIDEIGRTVKVLAK